jgi:PDZ domain
MLKKLFSFILLVATILSAQAADNPYEKNYKAQSTGNLASLQANPDTKIFVSNRKDEDNISMLENGFDMMGSSGFTAGDVLPELALQHAKAIKADTVLVYKKYGSTTTAATRMQTIKEAAKKGGGEIDENDLPVEPTPYKYYASYWAKLPTPLLGVHIVKLKKVGADETSIAEQGLRILAVVRGSAAELAGLKRGDSLLKIGNVELNKPEELSKVVREFQGKNVAIEYEREGVKAVTTAKVNQR